MCLSTRGLSISKDGTIEASDDLHESAQGLHCGTTYDLTIVPSAIARKFSYRSVTCDQALAIEVLGTIFCFQLKHSWWWINQKDEKVAGSESWEILAPSSLGYRLMSHCMVLIVWRFCNVLHFSVVNQWDALPGMILGLHIALSHTDVQQGSWSKLRLASSVSMMVLLWQILLLCAFGSHLSYDVFRGTFIHASGVPLASKDVVEIVGSI